MPFHHFQAAQHPTPHYLSASTPQKSHGTTSFSGDVTPQFSPKAATQGSSGLGVKRSGSLSPLEKRQFPCPPNTTITFHITWHTAQKRRGTGKADVSDRSK